MSWFSMRERRARAAMVAAAVALVAPGCKDKDVPARNRLWVQVQIWAKPTVDAAPHAKLDKALARIKGNDTVRDAWPLADNRRADTPEPQEVKEAVGLLVAWHRGGGGVRRRDCSDPNKFSDANLLEVLTLVRGALLWAESKPDDPRVAAALYLSHRIADEGGSLLHVMVAVALAEEILDWTKQRGLGPSESLRRYAPTIELVRRAYAAEAVCSIALLDTLVRDEQRARKQLGAVSMVSVRREIERVRYFQQQLVHAINARLDDPESLAALIQDRQTEFLKQDDPIGLIEMMVTPRSLAPDIIEAVEKYESFLADRPRTP